MKNSGLKAPMFDRQGRCAMYNGQGQKILDNQMGLGLIYSTK